MATQAAKKAKIIQLRASQPTVKIAVWKELASLREVAASMHKNSRPKKLSKGGKAIATARKK